MRISRRRLTHARWTLKQVQGDGLKKETRYFTRNYVTLNLFQGPFSNYTPLVRQERQPCIYILASKHYGSIYIGVTSDLLKRLSQHRQRLLPGHTSKYAIYTLVHFETFGTMEAAITREKQLKNWHRQWKINLINDGNPQWVDLAVGLGFPPIAQG